MSNKEMLTKDVVASNLNAFVEELVSLTKDGWIVVDDSAEVGFYGSFYTVSLTRDDKSVQEFKDYVSSVASAPKLTRAEILQRAREAKRNKLDFGVISD